MIWKNTLNELEPALAFKPATRHNLDTIPALLPKASEGFLFGCYAHEDVDEVRRRIEIIASEGFVIQFDDGAYLGDGWFELLAREIERSSGIVFFTSERSMRSRACWREVNFALSLGKPIVPIRVTNMAAHALWTGWHAPELEAQASDGGMAAS